MDTKKTVGIIGISHTYKSVVKSLEKYNYNIVICDIDKNKIKKEVYPKYYDYKELSGKIDIAFVSTPPDIHYDIVLYFLKKGIKVICEKPLVTNIENLNELCNFNNLFNILHFSHGDEINWFIDNFNTNEIPIKISCTINDPYIKNSKIKHDKLSLHGSYLDETINPLSAIRRIYKKDLKFFHSIKRFYKNDKYDYSSNAVFKMDNTFIFVNTYWNDRNNKEKYIDLYYKDKILRLDSINAAVIDLKNNKILYKSKKNRMDAHYENGLKDISSNIKEFYNLNKVILEGEEYAENHIY